MPRKTLLLFTLVFASSCLLYFVRSVLVTEPGYPLDDSWIHQVFARNIAQGHGFSFNPGEPMAGATAPLWTLALAALWPITGPVAGGILLGVILEWLALLGAYKIALFLTDDEKLATYLLLICAVFWTLIWGALSGMEVGLYSALSLWGFYFYLTATSLSDRKNYVAYFLLTLSVLARPECAMFLVGAIIRDFYEWVRSPKRLMLPWIGRAFIVAAIVAPYFVFNYTTTGTIVPQTYTAKTRGKGLISSLFNGDFKRVIKSLTAYPYTYFHNFLRTIFAYSPILATAFVAGGLKLVSWRDKLQSRRVLLVAIVVLYIPLMGSISPVFALGTYHHLRLLDNIVPLILMVGLLGLFWRPPGLQCPMRRKLIFAGLAAGIIGGILILTNRQVVDLTAPYVVQNYSQYTQANAHVFAGLVADFGRYTIIIGFLAVAGAIICARPVQALFNSRWLKVCIVAAIFAHSVYWLIFRSGFYANDIKNINEVDKAIGLYLREQGSGSVAVNDIGAIGYFSGMRVLDLEGLISPQMTTRMIDNDSLAFEYMYRNDRVDYVAIFPDWFKYIPTRTDILRPIRIFAVERNTILGDDTTIVYKAEWPDTNLNMMPPPR